MSAGVLDKRGAGLGVCAINKSELLGFKGLLQESEEINFALTLPH